MILNAADLLLLSLAARRYPEGVLVTARTVISVLGNTVLRHVMSDEEVE